MTTRATTAALTCLLTLAATACGGSATPSATPPTGDGPAALAVQATATRAPLAGSVTITATVTRSDGSPVAEGTAVGFLANGGTLLSTTPTDAAGHASAVLTSASRGPVTVFVTAGSLPGQAVSVDFVDPNAPFAISVTLSAAQANVRSTVLVTATVLPAGVDGLGGPGGTIPDGTVVTFTTSAGTLTAVSTTQGGEATAILGDVTAPTVVVIGASAGGVPSPPAVVSFVDPDVPSTVTVTANPSAGYTDGQRSVTLTAQATSVSGGPVPAGTPVSFAITAGSGGRLSSAAGVTDAQGLVSVVLDSGAEGPVTVSATVSATVSGQVTVFFTNPSRPVSVQLAGNPTAGYTDGQRPVTLAADVVAASGGPVPAGTQVAFAVTSGVGQLSAASVATDAAGRATVVLNATAEGSVTVTATVGGTVSGQATVSFTNPSRPVTVQLSATPTAGYTDHQRPVTLAADVVAASGGPVPAGTQVAFAVASGAGQLSAASAATDAAGRATVVLNATAEGPVTVTATAGGTVSGQATVFFTNPSRPVSVQLSPAPAAGYTDGQRPVTLTASVVAASGGAVPAGTQVAFAVTSGAGQLSAASAATDAAGRATVVLNATAEGSVSVTATAGGTVSGQATVVFTNPSRPAAVLLAASPAQGVTHGQRLVTLSASVSPADPVDGRIPDGTPVRFAIVGGVGTLSSATAGTAAGVATVTLDAADPGTVAVVARAGSAPEVSSSPVSATFIAQPTLAIVRVRTIGSLPAGALVGGVSAVVMVSPSAAVTLSAADVAATGAAAGALLAVNPADPAAAALGVVSATGFPVGEFATLIYRVTPGSFPAASDFAALLTGPGVIDAAGATIPLGVAVQSVTVQ